MNKYKKLAIAAVSVVMAGTMVASLAACNGNGDEGGNGGGTTNWDGVVNIPALNADALNVLVNYMSNPGSPNTGATLREKTMAGGWTTAKSYWTYLKGQKPTSYTDTLDVLDDTTGAVKYTTYQNRGKQTLDISIGYDSKIAGAFVNDVGAQFTLPDGNSYQDKALKPVFKQLETDLNVTFVDHYAGKKTDANLDYMVGTNAKDNTGTGGLNEKYEAVDIFTSDIAPILKNVSNSKADVLDLGKYLDYMPNLSKFLNENPIVYLSLLQEGMNTSTGEGKKLYVAPYFDGNDDIERYNLMRTDLVEKLLNGNTALTGTETFKDKCSASGVHVESYFGSTAYEIESLTADGSAKQTIKKDYAAAKAAAEDDTTALGKAYKAIAGKAYDGTSGNIVDIMNKAIMWNGEVTGPKLVDLYRAYIDVAYKVGANAAYTADKRANLFCGYDAAWDVDDLVALLRCVLTNGSTLAANGNTMNGIAPRSGENDRTPDMVRLAGQLYGVRGTESRYEYTYIDKDGTLQDARNEKDIYEACALLNRLKQENLIADYSGLKAFNAAGAVQGKNEYFMMYDYSQTQTGAYGFNAEDTTLPAAAVKLSAGFNLSPVINPVAKWTVDSSKPDGTIMRFTESWRSTKTGGVAINGKLDNEDDNPATNKKLEAALEFVDYLYSEDGQILTTFGPMATNAQSKGGFWYNTAASQEQVSAGQYFTYKGTKYEGTEYKGRYTPTVTEATYNFFTGKTMGNAPDKVKGTAKSFTNFARKLIGSTLPICVKDQSFENQLTPKMGQKGANIVGKALDQEIVKGMTLNVDQSTYWYTCVPTALPLSSDNTTSLNATSAKIVREMSGDKITATDKSFLSIFNYIILNGLSGTYKQQSVTYDFE